MHEESWAHVSVGLAAGYAERANFVVENNALALTPEGENELDEHLYALLNIHLGARDIDRFNAYPFFHPGKLMLQGGIEISRNPLDRLYLGLGYRLFKQIQLDLLYFWERQPRRDQRVDLADRPSLDDAKDAFDRRYRAGNLAVGISFYPAWLFGLLGVR